VVLAGDIDRGTKGVAWARQAFPDVPVQMRKPRWIAC